MDLEWQYCPDCQQVAQFLVEYDESENKTIRYEYCSQCGAGFETYLEEQPYLNERTVKVSAR